MIFIKEGRRQKEKKEPEFKTVLDIQKNKRIRRHCRLFPESFSIALFLCLWLFFSLSFIWVPFAMLFWDHWRYRLDLLVSFGTENRFFFKCVRFLITFRLVFALIFVFLFFASLNIHFLCLFSCSFVLLSISIFHENI